MATELPLQDDFTSWLKAIKAGKSALPNKKTMLLPILEDCVRQFQDIQEYRNDRRYLRLWIEYADCSPEPAKVFTEMIERQIGKDHSIFYSAYAVVLERLRKFGDAEAIYKLGLNRGAYPLERLQNDYKLFLERMALREKRKQAMSVRSGMLSTDTNACSLSKPETGHTSKRERASTVKAVAPINAPTASGEATVEIRSFAVKAIAAKDPGVEGILHHGLLEPTINTKEALNGILPMFSEPLQDIRKKGKPARRTRQQEFVVYHDEDLRPSSGVQTSSKEFVVFQDENLAPLAAPSKDFVVFKDENMAPTAPPSKDFVAFRDEKMIPSLPSKDFVVFTDENMTPRVPSSKDFTIFKDEDFA